MVCLVCLGLMNLSRVQNLAMGESVKQLKAIEDTSWYENVIHADFVETLFVVDFLQINGSSS